MNFQNKVMSLVSDESGGELVEYAIVIGVLATAVMVSMASIRDNVSTKFTNISTATGN